MDEPHLPQPERLSSRWTAYLRNVVPPAATVVIGAAAVATSLGYVDPTVPALVRGAALAGWILASIFVFKVCRSLRHVWLDGDELLVDDGERRVRIPLREVTAIRQSRLQKTKTITLTLSRSTPLGQKVRFVPHLALAASFMDHPVAKELRARREQALDHHLTDGNR